MKKLAMPKEEAVEVLEDADQYEIVEAIKDNVDQVWLEKTKIVARKNASDIVMNVMADRGCDIMVIKDVIKEIDDVKDLDLLAVLK